MKVGIALAPRSEIGNEIAQALLTSGAEPVLLAVDDPATLPQLVSILVKQGCAAVIAVGTIDPSGTFASEKAAATLAALNSVALSGAAAVVPALLAPGDLAHTAASTVLGWCSTALALASPSTAAPVAAAATKPAAPVAPVGSRIAFRLIFALHRPAHCSTPKGRDGPPRAEAT